ncbi:MAG: hypothetical protein AB7O52_06195 [Planctomycetota bacterium]
MPESVAQPVLTRLLARALRRQRALTLLAWAVWGLCASGTVGLLLVVYHRLLAPAWGLEPTLLGVLVAGPVIGALASLVLQRLRPIHAAIELERHYRLQERFSSALLLQDGISREAREALTHDVEAHSQGVDLRRALPLRRPRGSFAAAAAWLIVAVTYFALPTLDLLAAGEDRARNEEQARKVETRQKELEKRLARLSEIAKKEPISPETRELLEKLEARKHEPVAPQSPDRQKKEALAELRQMREDVKGRQEAIEKQIAGLERLTEKVKDAATPPQTEAVKKLEEALENGDLKAASALLAELGEQLSRAGALDSKAAAELGADLGQLMKKLGETGLDIETLEKLSQLDASDLAKLGAGAGDLAAKLSELERLMREKDLIDKAGAEIEFTEEELASLPKEWPDDGEICQDCAKKKGAGG